MSRNLLKIFDGRECAAAVTGFPSMDLTVPFPPTPSPQRLGVPSGRRRTIAMVAALGLLAAACGSSASTEADGAEAVGAAEAAYDATTTSPEAQSSDDTSSDDTSSDDTAAEAPAEEADAEEASEAASEEAADPAATLANYPQVDVIDLNSGETVDFASSVAGKGLPTLIWFYAPH